MPIHAAAPTLRAFLDLMRNSSESSNEVDRAMPIQALEGIPSLIDEFGCHTLRYRLLHRLVPYAETDPWETFAIAAKLEDEQLAKSAVRHMGQRFTGKDESGSAETFNMNLITDTMVKGVPTPYLMALVRALW